MNNSTVPLVDDARYRALDRPAGAHFIDVLDQRVLPHVVETLRIADAGAAAVAIRDMIVRGAPLIGAVGAYGLALALDVDPSDDALARLIDLSGERGGEDNATGLMLRVLKTPAAPARPQGWRRFFL